jgi:hypothetical protein
MAAKRICAGLMVVALTGLSGCCSWCDKWCHNQPAPAQCVPCCQPVNPCCPQGTAPVPVTGQGWRQPGPAYAPPNGCCQ